MKLKATPQQIARLGKKWKPVLLAELSIEDVFTKFKPAEILAHYPPEQRLAGLKPEEILSTMTQEEILSTVNPQVLENYLKQLKRQPQPIAKLRKKTK